jgi:hypothetical protein
MARAHEDLVSTEAKGLHMGFALGYITASSRKITRITGDKEILSGISAENQGKLKTLSDLIAKLAKNFENRNSQIYKERVLF